MPNMSGIDACKQIRDLGYDGVIISVTGNVLSGDQQEFLAAGADILIGKPFQLTSFHQTLSGN
jgi:CheY-like chemotaxis protein